MTIPRRDLSAILAERRTEWAPFLPPPWFADALCAQTDPAATPDADDASECHCQPCPGRGNEGHGWTHCAECCFGTGVEAEPGCPLHYPAPAASTDASGALSEALHRAFHDNWHPGVPLNLSAPDSVIWQKQAAAVERIVAARESAAATRARAEGAAEALRPIRNLAMEHANCSGCPTPWWLTQELTKEAGRVDL